MANAPQLAFNSGEWSPYMYDRSDLDKYASACRTLENFILLSYGGVRRRPGTEFMAKTKLEAASVAKLFKFQFSETTTFILEFGNLYIRFYSNRAQVMDGGSPVEVVTPYLASELEDLQYSQVNDEMRFVHPNHPPYVLRRLSDISWTFTEIEFNAPPFRDENVDETKTITPSGTSGTITLTASGFTFDSDVVGGYYSLGFARDDSASILPLTNVNGPSPTSPPIKVRGDWEIYTTGIWSATLYIQRRVDGGAWQNLRSWTSVNDRNISADGTELLDNVEFRLLATGFSAGSNDPQANAYLEVASAVDYGTVKITAVAGGGATATGTVRIRLPETSETFRWAEGSWSPLRGFPRSITLYQGRMIYGGCAAQAQTVWASDIEDFDVFTRNQIEDSDSFSLTIGGTEWNIIQWVAGSAKNLIVGTIGGEWSISSGDEANILTAQTARVVPESNLGSEHIQPKQAGKALLFVGVGGRKVMELTHSFEQDGFVSNDLTILAEHISKGCIKHLAYQTHRDPVLWAVTGDGVLIGMTYQRELDVVGWHRHTTDGTFESVAVVGTGDEEEEVWVVVKRNINGVDTRYVESFYPDMWRAQDEATYPNDLVFVDCATVVDAAGGISSIASITHLENETASILSDGGVHPNTAFVGTNLTLAEEATDVVIVGLPYISIAEPLFLEVMTNEGSSQGREKRIHELSISVLKSSVFKFGPSSDQLDTHYPRKVVDLLSTPVELRTEDIKETNPSTWGRDITVRVVQDLPLPLTVLSLGRKYLLQGNA